MPTPEADILNAGFDAAVATIHQDEQGLNILYRGYIDAALSSAAGRKALLQLIVNIKAAMDAAAKKA